MPTYEYKCTSCNGKFEYFQSMKDTPHTRCPVCKTDTLKRMLGKGAGIIFKGSGFYQTDYRSDSYKKKAGEDSAKPAPASSPSPSPKTESAPAKPDASKT